MACPGILPPTAPNVWQAAHIHMGLCFRCFRSAAAVCDCLLSLFRSSLNPQWAGGLHQHGPVRRREGEGQCGVQGAAVGAGCWGFQGAAANTRAGCTDVPPLCKRAATLGSAQHSCWARDVVCTG